MNKKRIPFRSVLCIVLAMFLIFAVGCVGKGSVKPNNDVISSNNSSEDVNSNEDNGTNYDTPTYTYEQNFDDGLNSNNTSANKTETNTGADTSSDNEQKPTTTTTTSTVTSTVTETIVKNDFQLELVQYHPGAPGFDVEYNFTAKFKDKRLSAEDYTISVNLDGVKVEDKKVIVPESVREKGGTLNVIAVYNSNKNYKSQINIKLKSWSQTWGDEFNVDGDRSNWSFFYMSENCKDENAYVKDGCLNLDVKVYEEIGPDGAPILKSSRGYVSTQNSYAQLYGCFRAKVLLMEGCYAADGGIMDSFWLIPQKGYPNTEFFQHPYMDTDAGCSEIDIFEAHKLGYQGINSAHHFWDESGNLAASINPEQGINKSYFNERKWLDVSYVWTKYAIYVYIDGMLNSSLPVIPVDDPQPAQIIFGTGITLPGESSWTGVLESIDGLPQTYSIDFCRTYQ